MYQLKTGPELCLSSINERQALSGKVSPGVSRPERLGRERGEERAVLGAGSKSEAKRS